MGIKSQHNTIKGWLGIDPHTDHQNYNLEFTTDNTTHSVLSLNSITCGRIFLPSGWHILMTE